MMDQVNKDSITATVSYLQSLQNRIYDSEGAYTVLAWIKAKFQALGLEVELQPFYRVGWGFFAQCDCHTARHIVP